MNSQEKLYLVTFACVQGNTLSYAECVTTSPAMSLLATRAEEEKRQEKLRSRHIRTCEPETELREFSIVNVLELTPEEAQEFVPKKITAADIQKLFDLLRPVKPDAVVEASS